MDSLSKRSNFSFYSSSGNGTRTLVILYGWLFAQQSHLDKFCALHMAKGFDVLSIRASLIEILFPLNGSRLIAADIFKFLSENYQNYNSIIFHTFSIGTYQMGELFVMLEEKKNEEISQKIIPLIKGIIFDSTVDVEYGPIGLAKSVTNNPLLQWTIVTLMKCHYRLLHNWATRYYIEASKVVCRNRRKYPALFFLSKNDEVADCDHLFGVIRRWHSNGVNLMVKCWDDSPHVCHFYKYPDEYNLHLDLFLDKVMR